MLFHKHFLYLTDVVLPLSLDTGQTCILHYSIYTRDVYNLINQRLLSKLSPCIY